MKRRIVVCAVLSAALAAPAVNLYVSPTGDDGNNGSVKKPVKTLQRALDLTREIERDERKEIVVGDGNYVFDAPVRLAAEDYDITIRAAHAGKAIFTGAVAVKGWRKDSDDSRFLVADLPFVPKDQVRLSLLVGDAWCEIASYPDFPKGRTLKLVSTQDKDRLTYVPDIDFSDVDMTSAWLVIPQEWTTYVSFVKEHDPVNHVLSLVTPLGFPVAKFNQGYRLMNARCGMRKPGMWMYEKKRNRLVYWPRKDETPKNIEAYLTRVHSILAVERSVGTRIEGIVFEGCSVDSAYDNPYCGQPNAALSLTRTRQSLVSGCEVRKCAGAGIFAVKPERVLVTRSHVHHVGAECICYFDGGTASDITLCDVHHAGMVKPTKAIGMQLSDCKCVGNKIHDTPGCGAVMWTANAVFASNEVYNCMFASRDGGGLYGGFGKCVLHDNYVHDISKWPGLYADEGSQDVLYYRNRFENCPWPIHMHQTQRVVVSNNVFKCDKPMRFSFQGSGNGVFCDNKIYTTEVPKTDPYLENCDFWGRNEFFVKRPGGAYKSVGKITLRRPTAVPEPVIFDLPAIQDGGRLPIGRDNKVDLYAFIAPMRWNSVMKTGTPGVPTAVVYVAYADEYIYFGVMRKLNALCGYPGMQNLTSTGWGHSDATRFSFEGGRTLTVFPNGEYETTDGHITVAKEDLAFFKGGSLILRLPLAAVGISGKTTEEVVGQTLKFNVSIWIEDVREEKSLFVSKGKDYATGTMRFAPPPVVKK